MCNNRNCNENVSKQIAIRNMARATRISLYSDAVSHFKPIFFFFWKKKTHRSRLLKLVFKQQRFHSTAVMSTRDIVGQTAPFNLRAATIWSAACVCIRFGTAAHIWVLLSGCTNMSWASHKLLMKSSNIYLALRFNLKSFCGWHDRRQIYLIARHCVVSTKWWWY